MNHHLNKPIGSLALGLSAWLWGAQAAGALDLTVNTTTDSLRGSPFVTCNGVANDCSLREALFKVNAAIGPHTITVPVAGMPYYLNDTPTDDDLGAVGDIDILQMITIQGAGVAGTVISGNENETANRQRIFHVHPQGSLTLRDLSVRKGGSTTAALVGGGIYADGPLTLERVQVRLNAADAAGGVFARSSLLVRDSTISANLAIAGAGLYIVGGEAKAIRNSTVALNTVTGAQAAGAGLYVQSHAGSLSLNNVTIAGNSAPIAGGIFVQGGPGDVQVSNTLVAANTASVRSPNCEGPSPGTGFASLGYNLQHGGGTCNFTQLTDQSGDPGLDLFGLAGGTTPAYALLKFSAALDKGSPAPPGSGGAACEVADQRGLTRALDGDIDGIARCDIGAVEGGRWVIATTTADTATGTSLRGLISQANALAAGPSGISTVITLPGEGATHTYRLTLGGAGEDLNATGDLDIRGDVTIVGQGATTTVIDGNVLDRVFHLPPVGSMSGSLALKNVAVHNGFVASGSGGGIFVDRGYASVIGARVRFNTAVAGGGISVGLPVGTPLAGGVAISDSALRDNRATGTNPGEGGGGVFLAGGGTTRIRNTTIAGNNADTEGGGLLQRSAFLTRLDNVTISGNRAGIFGVAGNGGGVAHTAGQLTVLNTIIAFNSVNTVGGGINPNCSGLLTSAGFNLVYGSIEKCGFSSSINDVVDGDPKLSPLQLNGGFTETMALGAGSAAIDTGSTVIPGTGGTACEGADQRGVARAIDGDGTGGARCDIGAYEAPPCAFGRPNVAILAASGGTGLLTVNVTASSGIKRLRGIPATSSNVEVDLPFDGATGFLPATFDVVPPGNPAQVSMTLRRLANGGAGTLAFYVTDVCGDWQTLAGGGVPAWGTGSGPTGASVVVATPSRSTVSTPGPTVVATTIPGAACATFATHAAAQAHLRANPTDPLLLDKNRNGIACEGADGAGFVTPPLDQVPVPRS